MFSSEHWKPVLTSAIQQQGFCTAADEKNKKNQCEAYAALAKHSATGYNFSACTVIAHIPLSLKLL